MIPILQYARLIMNLSPRSCLLAVLTLESPMDLSSRMFSSHKVAAVATQHSVTAGVRSCRHGR